MITCAGQLRHDRTQLTATTNMMSERIARSAAITLSRVSPRERTGERIVTVSREIPAMNRTPYGLGLRALYGLEPMICQLGQYAKTSCQESSPMIQRKRIRQSQRAAASRIRG